MDYIDSVLSLNQDINFIKRYFLRKKLKGYHNDYIQSCLEEIDSLMKWIEDNKKQIKEWESYDKTKYKDHILLSEALNKFLEANGHLLFLECDFRMVITHIALSENDWEYRFFARRAYSLLFAMDETYKKIGGEFLNQYEDLLDPQNLQAYKKAKGQLDKFLKSHLKEFKRIRNTNEAHKSRDLEKQKSSIEKMSVDKSWKIIQESLFLIQQLTLAINSIYQSFSEKNLQLMKKSLSD